MRKEIDEFGTICYYNENNELHKENGPAVEYENGDKYWYKNNLLHREDVPAIEYADGEKIWFKNGKVHRENGPAVEYTNGDKEYWYNNISYPKIKTNKEWKKFVKLIIFI